MTTISAIESGIRLLDSYGELGAKDYQRLLALLEHLDADGQMSATDACRILFDNSDDDASLRAFQTRVRHAQAEAVRQAEHDCAVEPDDNIKTTQRSCINAFRFYHRRKRRDQPKMIVFSALEFPPDIAPRVNRNYQEQHFTEPTAAPERLRLFISYARTNKYLAEDFREILKEIGGTLPLPPIDLWMDENIAPGAVFEQSIRLEMGRANYGLALLSKDFFRSNYILDKELPVLLKKGNLIPITLESVNGSCDKLREFARQRSKRDQRGPELEQLLALQWFELTDRCPATAFGDCQNAAGRRYFVRTLLGSRFSALFKQAPSPQKTPVIGGLEDLRYQAVTYELVRGKPLQQESQLSREVHHKPEVKSIDVIEDMFAWAELPTAEPTPPLYALLGDFGMGKTFTCREFARRFNKASPQRKAFYIDLRDTPTLIDTHNGLRVPTLEEIICKTLALVNRASEASDVEAIIRQVADGQLLLILDGLDERLTHFHRVQQKDYMDQLLKVFTQAPQASVKLLLSCRSHYFESCASQSRFFLSDHRGQTQGSDYRSVELLPFNDEQMQRLLNKIIGAEQSTRLWAMLNANPPLKDLASRPWILQQLSSAQAQLEAQQQRGQPVSLATVFAAIIEDTLSRDDEKHVLQRRHKRRLLRDLAAHLWRQRTSQIPIDALNDWYQTWLSDERLRDQYRFDHHVLEKDIRNSSLLVRRNEDEFSFGHTSMQEFFLAQWLYDQLHAGADELTPPDRLPSNETLEFLRQLLQKNSNHCKLKQTLATVLAQPVGGGRRLALRVLKWLPAITATGFERIDLSGLYLDTAEFTDLVCNQLILSDTRIEESRWRNARIDTLHIDNSALSGSAWVDCTVAQVTASGANRCNQITVAGGQWPPQFLADCARVYPLCRTQRSDPDRALPPALMYGHCMGINAVAFSPCGQRIVSAGEDDSIKVWNAASGECLLSVDAHQGMVLSVVVDGSGQRIVSAGWDGSIKLWDAASGKFLLSIGAHQGEVLSVAVDGSGQRIVSAGRDGLIKLWDAASDKCLLSVDAHEGEVLSVAVDGSGQQIVSAGKDGLIKLWDAASGECLFSVDAYQGRVWRVAVDGSGQRIVSAGGDGSIKLWNAASGECLLSVDAHESWVWSIAVDESGQRIVSAGRDGSIKLWDAASGQFLLSVDAYQGSVLSVAVDGSGQRIVSAGKDGSIKLWDAASGECLLLVGAHKGQVWRVAVDGSGQRIVSAGWDGSIKLWDATSGECLLSVDAHEGCVLSVAVDGSGQRIVSAGWDGSIKLWNTTSGQCLLSVDARQGRVQSVVFDSSGQRVVSAGDDGSIKIWDAANGERLLSFDAQQGGVQSVVFDSSGQRIVSAGWDRSINLWNAASGECLLSFDAQQGRVLSVAVDGSGQRIVSAGLDRSIKLWDATSGEFLLLVDAHQGEVLSVAVDGSGQRIVSTGEDGSIKLWDAASGQCLLSVEAQQGRVWSVVFDSSGQRIISAGDTIKLWRLSPAGDACTLEKTLLTSKQNQWLCVDHVANNVISTELAWRYANFSDGQHTSAIDAYAHRYLPSKPPPSAAGVIRR